VAFAVVFGLAVAAFAFLSFWTLRWAIRRDRSWRSQWLARREEETGSPGRDPEV
jgi:hypothetical protein